MKETIQWGIIGPGHIAEKFASDLQHVDGSELYAVASRDHGRAKDFAERYHAKMAYGSYSEIVKDKNVDIVYIATPHPAHCENTMLCLNHGKAVLCEKPFAMNLQEANKMVEASRRNRVFLMEAMWSRFNPVLSKVGEIVRSGELGKVLQLRADFGFHAPHNPESRVFNPALGGGSLLDVGIYPIFLSHFLLGTPVQIQAEAVLNEQGTDNSCGMVMRYDHGALSLLSSSVVVTTEQTAFISCENGSIEIPEHWHRAGKAIIRVSGQPDRIINTGFEGWGYQFEAMEAARCLRAGVSESEFLSLDFSLDMMKTLDTVRKICGLSYPADQT